MMRLQVDDSSNRGKLSKNLGVRGAEGLRTRVVLQLNSKNGGN